MRDSGQNSIYQEDNLTITGSGSKLKYETFKRDTYANISKVQKYSIVCVVVFLCYLVMFLLNIAISLNQQPLLIMLGCLLSTPFINPGLISLSAMITVVSVITSIVIVSPFVLGLHFKKVCSVKSSISLAKSLRWIVITLIGTFSFGFLFYIMYLSKSSPGLITITLFIVLVFDALQVGLLVLMYR